MTEATLGESEPIPRRHIEISNAHRPCAFEGCLGFLIGMLVELVAEGNATEAETEFRFEDLSRAVIHRESSTFLGN